MEKVSRKRKVIAALSLLEVVEEETSKVVEKGGD